MERDPREYPFGFFTGSSSALDATRTFSWFESVDDLADFILTVEPLIYGLEEEDLRTYYAEVSPILRTLRTEGFSDPLRERLNQEIRDEFVIDWWGHFDELVAAQSDFAMNIVSGFRDEETSVPSKRMS